ncbi:hypothetical protein CBM2625_B150012 [Cupriavidus taiwanensis]|nr:hypothetical protein CBM2625_B150012 [Cupriavidus taiwanensis]
MLPKLKLMALFRHMREIKFLGGCFV